MLFLELSSPSLSSSLRLQLPPHVCVLGAHSRLHLILAVLLNGADDTFQATF